MCVQMSLKEKKRQAFRLLNKEQQRELMELKKKIHPPAWSNVFITELKKRGVWPKPGGKAGKKAPLASIKAGGKAGKKAPTEPSAKELPVVVTPAKGQHEPTFMEMEFHDEQDEQMDDAEDEVEEERVEERDGGAGGEEEGLNGLLASIIKRQQAVADLDKADNLHGLSGEEYKRWFDHW